MDSSEDLNLSIDNANGSVAESESSIEEEDLPSSNEEDEEEEEESLINIEQHLNSNKSTQTNIERIGIVKQFVTDLQTKFELITETTMQNKDNASILLEKVRKRKALMEHARNKNIKYVWTQKNILGHFRVSYGNRSKIYKGITSVLSDVFFSNVYDKYNHAEETKKGPKSTAPVKYVNDSKDSVNRSSLIKHMKLNPQGKSICKCGGSGLMHGRVVAAEMDRMIKCYTTTKYNKNMIKFFADESVDVDAPYLPDFCVLRILETLANYGFEPIASEFPIYDEHLGIATSIDFICIKKNSFDICVFELKTGEGSKDDFICPDHNAKMKSVLSSCDDTPFHRASVQLLFSCIILQQKYDICVDRAYVIYCSGPRKEVHMIPLPIFFRGGETKTLSGKTIVYPPEQADNLRKSMYEQLCIEMKSREIHRTENRPNKKRFKKA